MVPQTEFDNLLESELSIYIRRIKDMTNIRVAGHPSIEIAHTIKKQSTEIEINFYKQMKCFDIFPKLFNIEGNEIEIENISHGMTDIMDLKLGRICYGKDADEKKKERMIKQAQETTLLETGMRLSGMVITHGNSHYHFLKEYGRQLTPTTLPIAFKIFIKSSKIKQAVLARLEEIIAVVKESDLACFGCSLLICHDESSVKMKLIDFAHSWWEKDDNLLDALLSFESYVTNLEF
ncbi:hypothetical protein HK103_000472 [Boothiomyces macroporosus]|uniref:Kinase n=1 Tax=Boothiomyces macroporosus TaxID=261099 RepID=A0AAD5UER2_9FUNG|nr:hypothetical protein HK103_000472 [Boothiomyces macroporosus]